MHRSRRPAARPSLPRLAVPATVLVLLAGCATAPPATAPAPGVDASPSDAPAPGDTSSDDTSSDDTVGDVTVRADGDRIVVDVGGSVADDGGSVADAGDRIVATVSDGELRHVAARPGAGTSTTVLALVRTTAGPFELRYLDLDVTTGEATDLYGFPWRLQVDPASAERPDAPPLPVWSPDGDAVAWLEASDDGVLLRTQGWVVHDEGSNPAEDGTATRLDDVPAGAALTAWTRDGGADALTATTPDGDEIVVRLVGDDAEIA